MAISLRGSERGRARGPGRVYFWGGVRRKGAIRLGWRLKVEIWTRTGSWIQCWIETRIRGVGTGRWGQRIPAGFVRVKAGLQVLHLAPSLSHWYRTYSRSLLETLAETSCLPLRLDGYKLDAGSFAEPEALTSLYITPCLCVRVYISMLVSLVNHRNFSPHTRTVVTCFAPTITYKTLRPGYVHNK